MSKLAENIIKNAYANRANAVIAAKQAADGSSIKQWLDAHPNTKKGLTAGGAGLGTGALTYGITRALGGSRGKALGAAGIAGGATAAGTAGYLYKDQIKSKLTDLMNKKRNTAAPAVNKQKPASAADQQKPAEQPRGNNTLDYLKNNERNTQNIIAGGINSVNKDIASNNQQINMLQNDPVTNAQKISQLQATNDKLLGKGPKPAESRPLTKAEQKIRELKTKIDMLTMGNNTGAHAQEVSNLQAEMDALQGKRTGQRQVDTSPRIGSRNPSKNWGKTSEELTGQDLIDKLAEVAPRLLSGGGSPEAQELKSLINNVQNLSPAQEMRANELLTLLGESR